MKSHTKRRYTNRLKPCFKPIIHQLKEARLSQGISQDELAYRIGIADGYLSKWECGERTPNLFNLVCWAKALDHKVTVTPIDPIAANDNGELIANDNAKEVIGT